MFLLQPSGIIEERAEEMLVCASEQQIKWQLKLLEGGKIGDISVRNTNGHTQFFCVKCPFWHNTEHICESHLCKQHDEIEHVLMFLHIDKENLDQ